jgi:hypothetical protein
VCCTACCILDPTQGVWFVVARRDVKEYLRHRREGDVPL